MERKNKDFYILRAVDVTVVFLILLFLGLFTKVISFGNECFSIRSLYRYDC